MDEKMQNKRNRGGNYLGTRMRIVFALAISLIVMVILAFYFSTLLKRDVQSGSVLGYTMKSSEMTSRMRINLLKAVELEKSAFMAITDEESKTFADQSLLTADTVERDYRELKDLVDKEKMEEEVKLLKEFGDCWKNFREIDKELLQLSVENTNIKATNLSYTGGAETIGRFERAFAQLTEIRSTAAKEARITKLAYQAVTAALTIYNLQAPHINEALDTKMDEIESVMKANEKRVRNSFNDLSRLVDERGRTFLDAASFAFDEFMKVNSEVVRLSRINSNIKSLQLSLGRKRKVAAQCEETLNSIQDVIRGRTFKATK
jgi:hypothetical protein